jgi:hypothetical protein
MSSFGLVSQMIVDKWTWVVAGLICITLAALALFFGSTGNDYLDDDDDDEFLDLENVIKYWGSGVLSMKCEHRKTELARSIPSTECEPNNTSGLDMASDRIKDEGKLNEKLLVQDDEEALVLNAEEPINEKEKEEDNISLAKPTEVNDPVNEMEKDEDNLAPDQTDEVFYSESPLVRSNQFLNEELYPIPIHKKKKSFWTSLKRMVGKK